MPRLYDVPNKHKDRSGGLNQAAECLSDRDGEKDDFYEILWIMKMSRMGKTEEEWQR